MAEDKHANPDAQPTPAPQATNPGATAGSIPVSVMAEPLAIMANTGLIGPPPRPGLLGIVEHFELVRRIGSGSMGIVFQARDIENGRNVALKILRPEFVEESRVVERFLQEARRLQLLKHDHLVPVLEVRRLHNGMFFVMPFFDAGSLAQKIKSGVPLASEEISQITEQVAQALSFAHRKGIIHRDIKPGNILLGKDGLVCLADFGLARTLFNDVLIDVERDQCEGTAPYMSPAVAAGEAEDTRCDIYALGAVMYEMLTGVPPYSGDTTKTIRQRILAGPPQPIREVNRAADNRLTQVAEWAMEREHRNRYASMADLAVDFQFIAAGKPPLGPHGLGRKAWFPLVSLQPRAKRAFYLSAVVGVLAIAAWLLWPRVRLEVIRTIKVPQVTSWVEAVPVRWDSQPGEELLVTENNDLLGFSAYGDLLNKWSCDEPGAKSFAVSMIAQVESNAFDVAFVNWARGTNLSLAVVNCNPYELKRFHAQGREPHPKSLGATSMLFPLAFVQADQTRDGHRRVIAALKTAQGGSPRALRCFDFETGKMLWETPVGPILVGCEMVDVNGDGFADFVCGSISVNNGNVAPDGSDDTHAYIFAISDEGKLLWRQELAGPGAVVTPIVAELGGNKKPEILAWVHSDEALHGKNLPEIGRMVRLGLNGKPLKDFQVGACLKSCLVVDLKGDKQLKVFCTDCEGTLHVLTPDLTPIRTVPMSKRVRERLGRLGRVELQLVGAARLLRGKDKELVLKSTLVTENSRTNLGDPTVDPGSIRHNKARIVVLNAALDTIAEFPFRETSGWKFSWGVKIADMDVDRLDEILSFSDHVDILKLKTH